MAAAARSEARSYKPRNVAIDLRRGRLRIIRNGRPTGVDLLADIQGKRQRTEQGHVIALCHLGSATRAEEMLRMTTGATHVHAHVLDDAEHGNVHLAKHLDPLHCVDEGDVLGRRDHDRAGNGNALAQRQLDIARPGACRR